MKEFRDKKFLKISYPQPYEGIHGGEGEVEGWWE